MLHGNTLSITFTLSKLFTYTIPTTMKSRVFTIAHQIKGFFTNWSNALSAAWKIAKLFLGYPVRLTFAKETGEVREADAIAMSSINTLEKGYFRFVEQIQSGTQWRSCKLERMIF